MVGESGPSLLLLSADRVGIPKSRSGLGPLLLLLPPLPSDENKSNGVGKAPAAVEFMGPLVAPGFNNEWRLLAPARGDANASTVGMPDGAARLPVLTNELLSGMGEVVISGMELVRAKPSPGTIPEGTAGPKPGELIIITPPGGWGWCLDWKSRCICWKSFFTLSSGLTP